jgi:hypothetical protein
MAIDAVPGSPTANAYLDVEEATVLLQGRLDIEAWYAPDPQEAVTLPARREAALIWATRLLDLQVGWYGQPATLTQALAWPQYGQTDQYGRPLDPTRVPLDIQYATAVYALTLLAGVTGAETGIEPGIKSKRMGETEIVYKDNVAPPASTTAMPSEVRLLLRRYGSVPGVGSIPVLRT